MSEPVWKPEKWSFFSPVFVVALLNDSPFRGKIKVMVGGAPISQAFADEIGADAYTEDAASCAQKAKELAA